MRFNPLWLLSTLLAVSDAGAAEGSPAGPPETPPPAEFWLYLIEFQDGDNDWVDPEALQVVSGKAPPSADDGAKTPTEEEKP